MQEVQFTLPAGSIIRDRYVVEDLLGKGGFGAVYLVRDQRVKGNLFALKEVIDPDRKDRARFIFEAEVLRRLEHRTLPRVYRVFDDAVHHRAYMLMDYIEGKNLESVRQQQPGRRFPLSQVLTLIAPIMDVVSYLHTQQPPILHRDIKPSNIIVPKSGEEAMLVDFGIAKEYGPESTTTAIRHCSPGYGAPEQYGQGTNVCTDVYGLGATCYALLTGTVPADALSRMTQLGSKEMDPLMPVRQLAPAVPQHVADAIHHAMSIKSSDRFASVEQFWQALNARPTWRQLPVSIIAPMLSAHPTVNQRAATTVIAPPQQPSQVSPVALPNRRRRVSPLLMALVLLICLGIGTGLLVFVAEHPHTSFSMRPATSLPTATMHSFTTVTSGTSSVSSTPHPTKQAMTPYPTSLTPASQNQSTPVPTSYPTVVPVLQPTPTSPPVPTPTPRPTPTPAPPAYPHLSGYYSGTVDDTSTSPDTRATISLSSIQQKQGSISGYFTVNQPLIGSNPFTGTVTTNKYIQFTVKSYNGNGPLFFSGSIQANGSMSGSYCSLDQSGHCSANAGDAGTWSASPGSLGSVMLPSETSTPQDYNRHGMVPVYPDVGQ